MGVLTLIFLVIHPIPECVDCEYSNPWGRNDAVYLRDSHLLDLWLILASFYAALNSLKRSWLVPLGIVFSHAATQFRGGVTWASFSGNEGPAILIMGLFVGGFSLIAGHLAGHVYHTVRYKLRARRAGADPTDLRAMGQHPTTHM